MKLRRTILNRREIKSSEGEFIYELENLFELSPKLSEQILIAAKECLLREYDLGEGQIEITAVGMEEKSGKVIEKMEKKKVRLTIDNGMEDIEVLREQGRIALRQIKIQRITEEAVEQCAVLSQEDISRHLGISLRTVKRDIKEIRNLGIDVITRGFLHNIGRAQTHKTKIIGLYLDGLTYSEIRLKTRHSTGAIKRYLESFTKVLMANKNRIYQRRHICAVTGMSEALVRQYQELIKQSQMDPVKKANMKLLIERNSYMDVKKTSGSYGSYRAVMTGGRS